MPWRAWSSFFSPFRGIAWPRDSILSRISAGALFLPVAFAAAQSSSSRNHSDILGAWEGESKCTVPDSPCHDERVFMGTLRCEYEAPKKTLRCTSRRKDSGDWEYTLSGDTLEGSLTINGKTRYRKIVAKKLTASSR